MKRTFEYEITQVESVDQLPKQVAEAFQQHLAGETVQRIMVVPPQAQLIQSSSWIHGIWFGWQKIPQRTLVFCEKHIAIIEAARSNDLKTTVIPMNALIRITFGKVLLRAYIEFVWCSGTEFQTIRVECHVANDDIINAQLNQIRATIAADEHDSAPVRGDDESERDVEALPFKFRNYLRFSLLPAECVLAAVFQPVMRQQVKRLYHRTIAPNRMVALTNQHVIFVEEEIGRSTSYYSVITHYYPIHCVQQVRFDSSPDVVWMSLSVGTPDITQDVDIPLQGDEAARLHDNFGKVPTVSVVNAVVA